MGNDDRIPLSATRGLEIKIISPRRQVRKSDGGAAGCGHRTGVVVCPPYVPDAVLGSAGNSAPSERNRGNCLFGDCHFGGGAGTIRCRRHAGCCRKQQVQQKEEWKQSGNTFAQCIFHGKNIELV